MCTTESSETNDKAPFRTQKTPQFRSWTLANDFHGVSYFLFRFDNVTSNVASLECSTWITHAKNKTTSCRCDDGTIRWFYFKKTGLYQWDFQGPPIMGPPKDMGMVWEDYHKGVPLLGVPGITLDFRSCKSF